MSQDHLSIWNNCLEVIKDNISSQAYKTWFAPIKALKLEDKVLTIQVPSQFFYEWLEEHYIQLLSKTIHKELGPDARLEYSIIMENAGATGTSQASPYAVKMPMANRQATQNPAVPMSAGIHDTPIKNPFVIPGLRKLNIDSNLNPNYNFGQFIEGMQPPRPIGGICRGQQTWRHLIQSIVDLRIYGSW